MPNQSITNDLEGFGIVALEAGLLGIPVLASGVDGIPDAVVHRKNGLLVPPAGPLSFINLIEKLGSDSKLRKKISIGAAEYVKRHYSWDVVIKKYIKVFARLS